MISPVIGHPNCDVGKIASLPLAALGRWWADMNVNDKDSVKQKIYAGAKCLKNLFYQSAEIERSRWNIYFLRYHTLMLDCAYIQPFEPLILLETL